MIHISRPPRPNRSKKRRFSRPSGNFVSLRTNPFQIPVPEDDMEAEESNEDAEGQEPPAAKTKHDHAPGPPASEEMLKARGWQVHDLGGAGDSGYRSLAGAMAHNKGKRLSEEEAAREGARIRYQAVSHLGNIWMNTRNLFCLMRTPARSPRPPKTLGAPVIIWYDHEGSWKRCTLAPGFNSKGMAKWAKDEEPVILRLQHQHYCWVEKPPREKIPIGTGLCKVSFLAVMFSKVLRPKLLAHNPVLSSLVRFGGLPVSPRALVPPLLSLLVTCAPCGGVWESGRSPPASVLPPSTALALPLYGPCHPFGAFKARSLYCARPFAVRAGVWPFVGVVPVACAVASPNPARCSQCCGCPAQPRCPWCASVVLVCAASPTGLGWPWGHREVCCSCPV